MKIIKARGRPRGKAAQGTQNHPYTPPLRSRYATRSSRGNIAPQLVAMPPSGNKPCLNSALIILNERQGASEPQQQHCSSKAPIVDDPVVEGSVVYVKPSISDGSPIISGPHNNHDMDLDPLCARITSTAEVPQEAAPEQDSHRDVNEDLQPPTENPLVLRDEPVISKITTTNVAPSTQSLSQCHSLNMTAFAIGLKDEADDDPDEVVSAPRLGYEFVLGHEVKTEIAGLVRAIYEKYGNITKECQVKSPSIFSFLLERMCDIYQTLEKKILYDLTLADINVMLDELRLCEDHKLNVGWLVKRLDQISETTSSSREYLMLKKEAETHMESKRKIDKDVEKHRKHLDLIQKEISRMEQKSAEKEAKASKCIERAIEIRARAKALGSRSLVHGLL